MFKKKRESLHFAKAAPWERLWLKEPGLFSSERSSIRSLYLRRSFALLEKHLPSGLFSVIDVAAGEASLLSLLEKKPCSITACDLSMQALTRLKKKKGPRYDYVQHALPLSPLPDEHYDLVICHETVGLLNQSEQRILMSTLARLCKKGGLIFLSNSLDIFSEGAWEALQNLFYSECIPIAQEPSFLRLPLLWRKFWKVPLRLERAALDPAYRSQHKSSGLIKYCLQRPSLRAKLFQTLALPSHLLRNFAQKQRLDLWEKTGKFLWGDDAVSHGILLGRPK